VRALNRPILSCILANLFGLLLVAAPACSATFDTDDLGADAGSGSSTDGGTDDGGDDDGSGDGDTPSGDAGDGDGGDDGGEPDGGGGEPDGGGGEPDGGGGEPDAGEQCGGAPGAECCSSDVNSCGDEWIECLNGSTCAACGGQDQPCCEDGDPCNELLGNLTCLLGTCGLPL
jgi:hypothetical protein